MNNLRVATHGDARKYVWQTSISTGAKKPQANEIKKLSPISFVEHQCDLMNLFTLQ
ncbi:TPA: hypothetical protein QIC20_000239 [Klebsiella aerogenes]|nr:hypothetical protein [Klebsiella aerogenes]HDT0778932.1 hypothetical protein [Klebsiella aerogenes]HDU4320302.1 hypothetical protein [Klebsiella aerogenes]